MELREWLIILGLALVSLIVIDGARRLQRQRRVPRLDQAGKHLSDSEFVDPEEAAKEAEINWELPNGGARVVKPADYSGLGNKPKLERQEHPGPSRVLSEFRRSVSAKVAEVAERGREEQPASAMPYAFTASPSTSSSAVPAEHERREPSLSVTSNPSVADGNRTVETTEHTASDTVSITASETHAETEARPQQEQEPVLRADPEDAVFAKQANEHAPKRRQLRSDMVGEHDGLDDNEVDEYRLVDFEGMGRSLKRRLIEHRKEKQRKKAEKAVRDQALAKQKAERKAQETEQRREAKEAADAERVRIAQEQAQAREAEANAAAAEHQSSPHPAQHDDEHYYARMRDAAHAEAPDTYRDGSAGIEGSTDATSDFTYENRTADARDNAHPTLAKALRHNVNGEHAKETLTNAEEVVVISVLSRDSEGFDGSKLLELMMACGLRYSPAMGIFHRFETESDDSELQFSMVNVVKPGTFPIEESGEFMTPGITLLMPLPGAIDSSVAFEAMVETAMVVVRHMGGELKDENRSVMTAQTIEFARQRVREFERRHRLHHRQAR